MKISRILGAIPAHTRIVGGALLIALSLLSAGCGQKGPLYLPSPTAAKRPTPVKPVLPVEKSPAVISPSPAEVVPEEAVPEESTPAETSTEPATETTR
ncbi:LPS translocon maturation chaperone LptM [Hydrogenophaga taeniospiralis]|uniref:LPS translocon maturation chaperone LptM n=1 Tax=Hydrogenophaga taeniospiralis TaxID=65656 RepID=UPI00082973AB|nr:lipoprotein [Hydrogenophaga taeniospiralis]